MLRPFNSILAYLALPLLVLSQGLTRGEVHDFEPGDVFQSRYQAYALSPSGPPTYLTDSVLTKTWSADLDTVTYIIHRRTYRPPSGPGLPPYLNDTLLTNAYSDLSDPAVHFQLPWPCPPILDSLGVDAALCGQEVWVQYVAGDTCFEPDTWTSMVVRGCGGPYYWSLEPAGPLHMEHELIYFRKEGVGCGDLITGMEPSMQRAPHVSIHPNPGNNSFQLTGLSQRHAHLRMLDLQGRVVLEDNNVLDQGPVGVSALPAGAYLVEVTTDAGRNLLRWVKE